jgi:hypothetical protein
MRLDHGGPIVLACCGSACELTLAGPSPIMGDGGTNYLVCCGGMAPAAQRGESMPESSPELRFGDACWLMKDAERKLRRRPLRSLCAGNCEAFDAVGCHPRVAVVHERRHRSTRIFDSKVSLPSLLAPIGRLRVLHLSSRRACRPRATVCAERAGGEPSARRGIRCVAGVGDPSARHSIDPGTDRLPVGWCVARVLPRRASSSQQEGNVQ